MNRDQLKREIKKRFKSTNDGDLRKYKSEFDRNYEPKKRGMPMRDIIFEIKKIGRREGLFGGCT
jgi:hypothetical protein